MHVRGRWGSFLAWFGMVQSDWLGRTRGKGRGSRPRSRGWSLAAPFVSASHALPRVRLPRLEPLEQRQVLTAGLTFTAVPFSMDSITQNLKVQYNLSTPASAAFSIALYADNGTTQTLLATDTVSSPTDWTVGNHYLTLSSPFGTEPQEDFRLNVVLDPGVSNVTKEFTGVFLDASGTVQVFGTTGNDSIFVAPSSGSQIRLGLNSVDRYFAEANVTDIHVRGGAGNDEISSYGVDRPFWAFGGDGNDWLLGGDAESYLDGGDGDDQFANGLGDVEAVGGDGDDWYLAYGTELGDSLVTKPGGATVNETEIDLTGMERFAGMLWDGENSMFVQESHLTAIGITDLWLVGGADADQLAVIGSLEGPAAGLDVIDISGGEGNNSIAFAPYDITRASDATIVINGGSGDDQIEIHQFSAAALPASTTMYIAAGSGNDILTFNNLSSDIVVIDENQIVLSDGPVIPYYDLDKIVVQAENSASTAIILEVDSSSPDFEVVGDADDSLAISRVGGGGVVSAVYDKVVSKSTTFEIADLAIEIISSGLKSFDLQFDDVAIENIALDQRYSIAADEIDGTITLDGTVDIPLGYDPGDEETLIENVSSATLLGDFGASHVDIGVTDYLLQFENDVKLVTSESAAGLVVTTSLVILHEHKWNGSAYVMDHENVPRFVTTPDVKTISSGDWSNPAIWSTGVIPGAGDKVRISADDVVVYDLDSSTEIDAIEVVGTLTYDTTINTKLVVGTLQVLPSGTLEIGTTTTAIGGGVSAILEFADVDLNLSTDPEQHGRGLLGFGTVRMHGSNVVNTWLRLDEHPANDDVKAGHTTLTFPGAEDLTGWDVGEFVVIPGTRQSHPSEFRFTNNIEPSQTEVRKIVSVHTDGGKQIVTLGAVDEFSTAALAYDHLGAFETELNVGTQRSVRGDRATIGGEELRPHVGLLSRNVIVRSANSGDSYNAPSDISGQRRGHVLFSGRADVDIQYTMFQDLGRTASVRETSAMNSAPLPQVLNGATNHIGRYSVHFHHMAGPADAVGDYQYVFKGNTIQGALKWGVAVHHTHYGLIQDNVAYDVQGAAFVTEDGSEVGNKFDHNFAVKVYGTFVDGDSNSNQATTQAGNFGQGGVGFWFRRAGNDFTNNVAADVTYAHLVITSYYHQQPMMVPEFPGAGGHHDFTPTLLIPSGVIDNNEFYGPALHAVWLAYTAGDNLAADHPTTTISDLKIWNTQIGVRAYHVSKLTFDDTTIYGDPERLMRADAGTAGMSFDVQYESNELTINNPRIEGMRIGIATPRNGKWILGQAPIPTIIQGGRLENITNIVVQPPTDLNQGGQYLQIDNVDFEPMERGKNAYLPSGNVTTPKKNIWMFLGGKDLNFTSPVVVQVTDYDQVSGDDFQLYFEGQHEDAIMPTSNWDWFLRFTRQIGAPAGSYMTNQDAYTTYGIATAGFIAPASLQAGRSEIIGLLGVDNGVDYEKVEPWMWDPKVVLTSPVTGSSFIEQHTYAAPYVHFRYNVEGTTPVGAKIRFSLTDGTNTWYLDQQETVEDNIFYGLARDKTYTLRGYMANALTNIEISGTATEVTFDILDEQINDVTLMPLSIADSRNGIETTVNHLMLAAGGDFLTGKGMIITGISAAQGKWQYWNPSSGWVVISTPGSVSSTAAIALPNASYLRFVVDPLYTYSALDPAPELTFYTWTKAGSGISDFATGVDSTDILYDSYIGTDAIKIIQPLLA